MLTAMPVSIAFGVLTTTVAIDHARSVAALKIFIFARRLIILIVKKLDPNATLPTITNPGEDLGYDLYALEDTVLFAGLVAKVKTGVALEFRNLVTSEVTFCNIPVSKKYGLLIRDRSSMASKGIIVSGGVVDAGYRGECVVLLTSHQRYEIKKGDKIAQVVPLPVEAFSVIEVPFLSEANRGESGFGSSGR